MAASKHNVSGDMMTLKEVALMSGVMEQTLRTRMVRHPDKDLSELLYETGSLYGRKGRGVTKKFTYNGEELTAYKLAKVSGYSSSYMRLRLDRMTVEDAMNPLVATPGKGGRRMRVNNKHVVIPSLDPNLEINNRIESYKRMGMTEFDMIERESKKEAMYA